MHSRIKGSKLHNILKQHGEGWTRRKIISIPIPVNNFKGSHGVCLSKRSMERRKHFLFANIYCTRVKFIFMLVFFAFSYVFVQNVYLRLRYRIPSRKDQKPSTKLTKSSMSPFDSHPPKFVALNGTSNIRHSCLEEIRNRRHSFYLPHIENANHVLLVDPAYHSNVGDHMITIAELTLLQSRIEVLATRILSQCSYVQAHDFVPSCDVILQKEVIHPNEVAIAFPTSPPIALSSSATDVRKRNQSHQNKIALWHGGGNFGNLWATAQQARIQSIVLLLQANYTIIGMPNSWYYTNIAIESKDIKQLRENIIIGLGLKTTNVDTLSDAQLSFMAKSRIIWTWREHYSYEHAMKLLPYCTHELVPDIAFQLGPYRPVRSPWQIEGLPYRHESGTLTKEPATLDIVFLLRNDHESLFASVRNRRSIQSILDSIPGASQVSFSIVDWDDRLSRFQPNNPTDIYFTESAIQLLSMGTVLICDRLHAAILAYISDLSFIYLDQISGKIHKTFTVAMESGPNCQRSSVTSNNRSFTLIHDAQKSWSHAETVHSAVELAVQIIQQEQKMDKLASNGRLQRSTTREQRRNQIRQKLLNS